MNEERGVASYVQSPIHRTLVFPFTESTAGFLTKGQLVANSLWISKVNFLIP